MLANNNKVTEFTSTKWTIYPIASELINFFLCVRKCREWLNCAEYVAISEDKSPPHFFQITEPLDTNFFASTFSTFFLVDLKCLGCYLQGQGHREIDSSENDGYILPTETFSAGLGMLVGG